MNRADVLTELRRLLDGLPEPWPEVVLFVVRRIASGQPGVRREGISTAAECAAHACDIAIERIAEFLQHGPDAVVSPAGISPPRR
ncbi:hypothetical protein [Sorangium sp. So ce131]|uniref:hypothetical protein n=1 Tax=Sorangium sp. So ce131 TaxID=3133282 RepID=UPI003F5ED55A